MARGPRLCVIVCVPIGSWPALAPLAAALGKDEAVSVSHCSLCSVPIMIKGRGAWVEVGEDLL
jgi:hypothetical protein